MFYKPGKKIKSISKIIFFVAAILTFAGGIALAIFGIVEEAAIPIIAGAALALIGPVLSYWFSLLTYGFGELIENVISINNKTTETNDKETNHKKKYSHNELPDL